MHPPPQRRRGAPSRQADEAEHLRTHLNYFQELQAQCHFQGRDQSRREEDFLQGEESEGGWLREENEETAERVAKVQCVQGQEGSFCGWLPGENHKPYKLCLLLQKKCAKC
jgi:hypothetical protein